MPYFTTAELRALPDMDDTGRFPDLRLVEAHDWIVSIIEEKCETSFIPTVVTETLTGPNLSALRLSSAYVQSVSAVTVDSVAFTGDQIAGLIAEDGYLYQTGDAAWSAAGRRNVTVTYTAGYSTTPPADLKQAALRAARNWLLTTDAWSGADTRATSITNDYGNVNLAVASENMPTGLPDVDAAIMRWAHKVRVPKVS